MMVERLYPFVPVWVQNLGISLYGFSYRRERFGGDFEKYVHEFRERDRWPRQQMTAYVEARLRTVLLDCFDHVPYYREKWSSAGIARGDISLLSLAGLSRLPVTPKADLRRDPELSSLRTSVAGGFNAITPVAALERRSRASTLRKHTGICGCPRGAFVWVGRHHDPRSTIHAGRPISRAPC